MAIIYSYPDNENLLLTDMLIGTSTIRVNGRKKNITKNFTLEALGMFISENFPSTGVAWGDITGSLSNQTDLQDALDTKQANITLTTTGSSGPATFIADVLNIPDYSTGYVVPTLQSVTDEGNTTTTPVYLNGGAVASGADSDSIFDSTYISSYNYLNNTSATISSDGSVLLNTNGFHNGDIKASNLTAAITLEFPNKPLGTYTIATTDELTLQGVVDNGNTVGSLSSYYSELNAGEFFVVQGTIGTKTRITADGYIYFTNGGGATTSLSNTFVDEDNVFIFPNKPTGTPYTLATTADLPDVTGFVPYTGATSNVDLGEYELKAGQITLDTSPTGTAAVATTRWNDTIGSSETTLKGGNVVLKNGIDLVARVVNKVTPNTTLTKAAYQAVRVSGAQGQRLAVAYAQANSDNNSADTIGLVCEDIATNQEGFIITVGQLDEINTTGSLQGETWADGDVLYLSPITPGHITNIKPTGLTGHIVVMGYVEYAHAIHGKIYVKIMNGWELDELHNVYITSPANRDVLAYDSSTQLWENKSFRKQSIGGAQFFTDFISAGSATPNLVVITGGTGATTTKATTTAVPNQTANQIGICQYQTGTTSTGWAAHINDNQGALAFSFGGGSWVYETFIEVDTLSTLTEQFRFLTGFATQGSVANEVNGIIFTYDSGGTRNGTIASPNWQCVTSDNSTRTLTTTSVAVTTTWTKLRIEINAAATEVKFYINGTLVATHTQNIPTFANSRFLIMKQQLVKSAGTTNRSVYCDYLLYENNLTTLR